jgi:hypothetical protein
MDFLPIHDVLTARNAVVPVAGGIFTGMAIALFRGPKGVLRALTSRGSGSLMNFSSHGTLRCICGAQHSPNAKPDRRQFCRSCGCEVVPQDKAMLEKSLSRKEITAMTRSLRRAAIRASHLELPPTITTVEQLHRYLESSEPKHLRSAGTRATSIEQTQVH